VISGTAAQGQTVMCSTGSWISSSQPTYSYTWQRDGLAISGQTSNQYTLAAGDVNQAITCTVAATNSSGTTSALSLPIVPLAAAPPGSPIAESPPVISGNAVQGQTVVCSQGTWLGASSYSYAWQRDGLNIAGQTSNRYTLTSSDVTQAITCSVVAGNTAGNSLPAISLPIIPSAAGGSGGGPVPGLGTGNKGGVGSIPGLRPPNLSAFSVTPRQMVVSTRGRRQTSNGVTFTYRLDRAAGVLIVLEQRLSGRRAGNRCVAVTRRNKKARSCTRYATVKVLAVSNAKAGTNRLKYAGRVGAKLLSASAYRALVAAANTAGWSKARSASFAVVQKRVKVRSHRRA
jgi:hypothetical protein